MKLTVVIACILGAVSASQIQCSKGESGFDCFSIETVHVCPADYFTGLPSCVGIDKSINRRPCDAGTNYFKCIKQGRPLGCNCDSTLGKWRIIENYDFQIFYFNH